jgi:glutathione peroxidase
MKYFFALIAFTALLSFRFLDDIYSLSLKSIDGEKIELSKFRGKKMLFIILPLSKSDSTISINEISQLQSKYQSSLVVIGIPAEETGFKKEEEGKLKKLYKDAAANFIITDGMKVKKGTGQSSLFEWLTNKDKNHHFDKDVQGVGSKFFVDEAGELYAVMGPQLKLTSPVIDKIIARPHLKK